MLNTDGLTQDECSILIFGATKYIDLAFQNVSYLRKKGYPNDVDIALAKIDVAQAMRVNATRRLQQLEGVQDNG